MLLSDFGFDFKERYELNDLIKIVEILRSDIGCCWDREQNHKSIRNDFLEETYEVIEAIDNNDTLLLKEELGDVLLQIVFHSRIEEEQQNFVFADVADDISKKLIIRHPHVFGDVKVSNTDDVLKNWDNIKKETKKQDTFTDTLNSVPKILPALLRSSKIAQRSKRAGFEVLGIDITNLLNEYLAALQGNDKQSISDSLGKLLFYTVKAAQTSGVNSEEALSHECDLYIAQFENMEDLIRLEGKNINSLSINELSDFWSKAGKQKNQ